MLTQTLLATWGMISTSSFWLLAGFFFAGVLHVVFPARIIDRHLKKPGFGSVLKASLFGIPLPLCSCSVIPVGTALRRKGASRGATSSFFVSTPEIGVDSFLLSYVFLGPLLAITRVISAFFSALVVGLSIDALYKDDSSQVILSPTNPSCCAAKNSNDSQEFSEQNHFQRKLREIFRYGFGTVVNDLAVVLTIGYLISGLITAFVPADIFQTIGLGQHAAMFTMLIISTPLYICATSATPLAAALIAKGLNPGAALVFLLAGPATNITTILAIKKEIGKLAAVIYVLGIMIVALLTGYALDYFLLQNPAGSTSPLPHFHEHTSPLTDIGGLLLIALLGKGLLKKISERRQKALNQNSRIR